MDPHGLPSVKSYYKQKCAGVNGGLFFDSPEICSRQGCGKVSPCDTYSPLTNAYNPQGILPLVGRTALTPLTIDPMDAFEFKPPKNATLYEDLYDVPRPQLFSVHGAPSLVGMERERVDFQTKTNGPSGAMNGYLPSLDANSSCFNGTSDGVDGQRVSVSRAFGKGMFPTKRYWGFHQTLRPYYGVAPEKTQLQWIPPTPDVYVGKRGEIGSVRTPFNAFVQEKQHKAPLPTSGRTGTRMHIAPPVVLRCNNRHKQLTGWSGPKDVARGVEAPDLRLRSITDIAAQMGLC